MRKALAVLILLAAPALAQEEEDAPGTEERGFEQLLRDLFSEVEPALRGLRDRIEDLGDYEAPEMLPNGDIIIRRKTPLETPPDELEEGEEVDPGESIEL